MTICRFFVQGRCRFGDRCRFEHVENSYNNQSYSNNQWNAGNYERQGSNYNRDNEYRNKRNEPRNYYNDNYQDYTPDKYGEKFSGSSGQNNDYWSKQRSEQYHNYEQNHGKKQHQYSSEYGNENTYGQNRFRWLSDDYKNQAHVSAGQNAYEYGNDSYTTSTPKGKTSFSFKVPESEVKKGSSHFFHVDEQDQLLTELIHEDAKSWELGGQWPFTSYFPYSNKCAFPGFYDVSPEELRYAAYKSEENDSSKAYIQAVQNALNQVNQQRSELKIATPQLLSTLRKIRNGEDIYSPSQKINPIASIAFASNDNVLETMEMPDISVASNNSAASFSFKAPVAVSNAASPFSFKTPTPISNAASSFSFKIPSETDSAVKTSASSFSFKLPSGSETKLMATTVSDGDINIYTPLGNLTDEEKEQFSASTFVLGKIPTKPPPLVFCN